MAAAAIGGLAVPKPAMSMACALEELASSSPGGTCTASMAPNANWVQARFSSMVWAMVWLLPVNIRLMPVLKSVVKVWWSFAQNMLMVVATATMMAMRAMFITIAIIDSRDCPVIRR